MESVNFYNRSVFYHLCVPSFYDSDQDGIGDIKGVIEKIPYLHMLGVDGIVLSPIFESDRNKLRFAVSDYYRVNPLYGSDDDFTALIEAAHGQGLKVLLSLPISCTSTSHEWFEKSSDTAESNPFREYYYRSRGKDGKPHAAPDKIKDLSGTPRWYFSKKSGDWYRTIYGKDYPTLNYNNPRVRKQMTDVFLYWKQKGADGFFIEDCYFSIKRLTLPDGKLLYNVTDALFNDGGKTHRFLREVREKLGEDTPMILTAEGTDPSVFPYLTSGEKPIADSVVAENLFSFNRLATSKRFSKRKFFAAFMKSQKSYCKRISLMLEDRVHRRFLSAYMKKGDLALSPCAKFLSAILLTSVGTPNIYQGEELGMSNFSDADFRKKSKKTDEKQADISILVDARSPFQWDNKFNAGFTEGGFPYIPIHENYNKINAAAEARDPQSILNFYREMIAFRKASSALTIGSFEDHSKGHVLCYVRSSDTERILIIANSKNKHMNFTVPGVLLEREATCEVCNYPLVSKPIHPTMGLRPYEVRIFRLSPILRDLDH